MEILGGAALATTRRLRAELVIQDGVYRSNFSPRKRIFNG